MLTLASGQYSGDVVANLSVGDLLLSLTDYRHDAREQGLHSHANPHLSLFLSGEFVVRSGRCESECRPGHVVLFRSDDSHATRSTRAHGRAVNLEVTSSYFDEHELSEADLVAAFANTPGARLILLSAYREMLRADALSRLAVGCRFLRWLGPPCRKGPARVPQWAHRVRDYLHEHWHSELSLTALAAIACCHPVTIAKYFPRYFGCTVGEYVRRLRTERAVDEIRGGDGALADIACICGFSDQSHLTREVRRYTGFTPGQLRAA